MRIDTSQVALLSQHTASMTESRQEQLQYWVGDVRPATRLTSQQSLTLPAKRPLLADRLELSAEMRQKLAQAVVQAKPPSFTLAQAPHGTAKDGDPKGDGDTPSELDSDIIVAEGLIEALTGEKVEIRRVNIDGQASAGGEGDAADSEAAKAAKASADGQQPQRAGWGLEYRYDAVHEEKEQTSFAAAGHVTTADGREIDFALETQMSRTYRTEEHVLVRAGDALKDPLILNFGGPAGTLSEDRVQFDLNADGQAEAMPFAGPGSGFLVYDRDNDGAVDDGTELFGPQTGDGFAELAALDADGNQWIDEADPAYAQLKVWTRDGGSDAISSLQQKQVGAIYVGSTATPFSVRDASNGVLGQVQESGVFLYDDGRAGAVQRVDVKV